MLNVGKLAGYTLFVTGASRGIGKEIALKAARDGANVVIAAKTAEPHPKLPGTIYTAAEEIVKAGGKCLPCVVDVRSEEAVQGAVDQAVKEFGGIDIVVNNASAISLTGTLQTPMKVYDLMNQINTRGTYLCSRVCLPHLIKSKQAGRDPHILNISPPLNMNPIWFKGHTAYTIAKYGMSMCVLGMADELRDEGIAVNALWPRTAIHTAAMDMIGGDDIAGQCRKPSIMSDAAYAILIKGANSGTGQFLIDDDVLKEEGITNFDQYAIDPGRNLIPDFFLDSAEEAYENRLKERGGKSNTETGGSVQSVFDRISDSLNSDLVNNVGGVYKFVLSEPDEIWILDLKNGEGSINQCDGDADVTMTVKGQDFSSMFKGDLNATQAFIQGKLKIEGNMGLAMKLEKVMKAAQSGSSTSGGGVSSTMQKVEKMINSNLVKEVGAVYQFVLKGNYGGKWVIDLKNGDGSLKKGSSDEPDVTMELASEDFVKMFTGELNSTQAFMQGKLKINGNMGLAMKLEKVIKSLTSAKL
uniref:hydroxysteroid dehydrogenase-like protein 2 n=1 Tax=Styela clava TaxID=7725 RepID=UPI0019394B38|nr:hydroxysteroid dehydrogenase-like protein 2 [Styela clava]